jgi:4-hydroxyphenylacetate 3-monooxygenase
MTATAPRAGADYRAALRDGRDVRIMGEGRVDDVTTHPATRAMVDEYVAWYDLHFDPEWRDIVLTPPDSTGARIPWGYVPPRDGNDLRGMGRSFTRTTRLSAGNITHTPAYGAMIALGVQNAVLEYNAFPEQIANAAAYRDHIAATGRFLTFCAGAATIGYRLRANEAERNALRIVRETDAGVVVSGKIGMHTSPAYAEDVYIGSHNGATINGHRASFVVAVNAPGVTVLCRPISARPPNLFSAPLSTRFDELDAQMWLNDVFIPWERVFLVDPVPETIARWLFWHQLYCWLSKAEFTLGLALACAHATGLLGHQLTVDYIVDLITDVQTVRACQTAAECDPSFTPWGHCYPNHAHVAAGSIAMLKARPRMSEILRILPGSSLIMAPTDTDLDSPELAAGFEESFGGGGYTARQRSALLRMAWDHVGSALEARESVYELHANGGIPAWRGRLRRAFDGYDTLTAEVVARLDISMPPIDVSELPKAPLAPRRVVTAPRPSKT